MGLRRWMLLIPLAASLLCTGCRNPSGAAPSLSPERRASVEQDVRRFTAAVAHDVTLQGPTAWKSYFAEGPEFFMAVNGQLAFPNGQAAAQAIPQIAPNYQHIELRWSDDLRVDVLTENLCMIASSYTEVIELRPGVDGMQGTQNGYFTGLAEMRNGRWQFRDAHWSLPLIAAKAQ